MTHPTLSRGSSSATKCATASGLGLWCGASPGLGTFGKRLASHSCSVMAILLGHQVE